jgi:hypothetical protein
MIEPYRYESEPRAAHASWHGRVVFNLYDDKDYWIARVAGETRELAIVEARRHAAVRMMESALRTISVNPEAAIALHDHPAWKTLTEALRFIDEAAVQLPAPRMIRRPNQHNVHSQTG